MHFRMHDVATSADTGGMDVGRFLSLSAAANNGSLALVAAIVVLLVLVWAISSPFWEIPDEPSPAEPARSLGGFRPAGGPADVTSPLPRALRANGYGGPRHAAGPPRPPNVSGSPPWGPAPRPPGIPPAGW
jgi:hypothetical protein